MRYYIDTEFNGSGGQLLSIALVREDGRHFYAVLHAHELIVPWVAEHVMPFMEQDPVDRATAVKRLQKFLRKDRGPHIFIADWPEDFVHFHYMLMRGHGKRNDPLQFATLLLNLPEFDTALASEVPHNALADAQCLKDYVEAHLRGERSDMSAADSGLLGRICGETHLPN